MLELGRVCKRFSGLTKVVLRTIMHRTGAK
jgi:hypothetical protein